MEKVGFFMSSHGYTVKVSEKKGTGRRQKKKKKHKKKGKSETPIHLFHSAISVSSRIVGSCGSPSKSTGAPKYRFLHH